MAKACKLCGGRMVYMPDMPDIEDWPICHDCMVDHCCRTNCLGCEHGKYPDCRFLGMKRLYMSKD